MDHDLDERHDATRRSLHRIANHVLARAQVAATDQLGLRAAPGGFATTSIRPDHERIRVSGGIVVRESAAAGGTWTRSVEIDGATLAELAAFADVDLADEFWAGHDMPPVGDINEPITLHTASARLIGQWYAVAVEALDRLIHTAPAFSAASLVQVWPEHFDAALDMAFDSRTPAERRVNMGGSPGDGFHAAPYLYVGPWTSDRPGDEAFWNAPFGAVLSFGDVATSADPVDTAHRFFVTGLERLTA